MNVRSFRLPRMCNFRLTSTLFVLLSVLSLPIAAAYELDLPSWLIRALKKDDPVTLGHQVVLKACSRSSFPLTDDGNRGEPRRNALERSIPVRYPQGRCLTCLPNEHMKVANINLVATGIGILVPYARVALAFLWLDGTPLSLDMGLVPSGIRQNEIILLFALEPLAVDGALRAYIRANFAADM